MHWAIDSIRAFTRDLVSGYPGKTHLPGQSRIWAYLGIRANWREACLPLYPGRTKLSGINLAYPGIHKYPGHCLVCGSGHCLLCSSEHYLVMRAHK